MAGLGWYSLGAIKRQCKCAERIKRRQKRRQNGYVIQRLINAPTHAQLFIAPRLISSRHAPRAVFLSGVLRFACRTVSDFMLNRMDLVMHGAENRVLAPKPGKGHD